MENIKTNIIEIEKTIRWNEDESCSEMIEQNLIPYEYKRVKITSSDEMFSAIKTMIVRGAPAIGIAGAHGVILSAIEEAKNVQNKVADDFLENVRKKAQYLISSRPTAVNLLWAVNKQLEILEKYGRESFEIIIKKLVENAKKLEEDDIEINKKIGDFGAKEIQKILNNKKGITVLTHCNAGRLATVGYGTALGVVRSLYRDDNTIKVFADETRPRAQGARLTTYELIQDGINTTLITDNMSAYFMYKKMIDVVVVGADRIAQNGDTANKIGTYLLSIAAKYHNIPFFVAAPKSTIDPTISSGDEIKIELRDRKEVTTVNEKLICTDEVNVINPSFDITNNSLITGIITEYGVFKPNEISKLF